MKKNSSKLSKKDLLKVFWRSFSYEWSWNYERQGNLGFLYTILPSLKKIYSKNPEKLKDSYRRHLEFYNITPWICTFPMGVVLSLEEENEKNKDFSVQTINSIKLSLMGPLSSLGDAFFWGTLRVIATAIGISLSLQGSFLGPIAFLLIFNVPAIVVRYYSLFFGYNIGTSFVSKIQKSRITDKLSYAGSIVSLAVVGGMIANMVTIYMPIKITNTENSLTLQNLFDSFIPGILTIIFTFFIYYLDKKGLKFYWILLIIMIIGILGSMIGILGIPV